MRDTFEKLNKVIIIVLCFILLSSSVNLSILVENMDVITDLFSDIVSLFETTGSKNDAIFGNRTLIVQAENKNFNTYGAESVEEYQGMYIVKYKTEKETETAYKKLIVEANIASVEADASIVIQENNKKTQVAISEKEQTELGKYLKENTKETKEIKVAILDTGVNLENEQLKNRIIDLKTNLSSSGKENEIIDDNGHGTEIAQMIAENTNEKVKIMPIKIANKEGKASILNAYKAIEIAIENGADIINLSMNTVASIKSKILEEIINRATNQGIVVVVSAGNRGTNVEEITPSNIETAIVVSAVNTDNTFASYSNYGKNVDFTAYGNYNGKEGTSYAAANVTSVIAELLSQKQNIDLLNEKAVDLGKEGRDDYYGKGFIGFNINASDANTEEIKVEEQNVIQNENELSTSATGTNGYYTLINGLIGNYRLNYTGNINHHAMFLNNGSLNYTSLSEGTTSATLTNDGGYTIVKAYLLWTCRDNNKIYGRPNVPITLSASGRSTSVTAQNAYIDNRYNILTYYRLSADVTNFVKASANGGYTTYSVSGLPTWPGGSGGGDDIACWQLIVVEENPNLPVRIIQIQDGSKYIEGNSDSMTVTLPYGFRTKSTGTVTGQLMMAYLPADPFQLSITSGNTVYAPVGSGKNLYKNGVPISREHYYYTFNLSDVSGIANSQNSLTVTATKTSIGWSSLMTLGIAVDLDMPKYSHNQSASLSSGNSQVVTITGTITNTESPTGCGIRNGQLTLNIDPQLRIESIASNNVYFKGGYYTAQKVSDNQIRINLNGSDWMRGESLTYTVQARVVKAGGNKATTAAITGYIGGELIANNNATGYNIAKMAEVNSNASAISNGPAQNIQLIVNPNGGTWNGSSASQSIAKNYQSTSSIAVPTRNAYSFTNWTVAGAGSSMNGNVFTMGYVNATLTANWSLNTKNINGTISWDDQNNKYNARPQNVELTLHRDQDTVPILKEADQNPITVTGLQNTNYTFTNTQSQKESNNQDYQYTVTQNVVPGYETIINGYGVTNKLILPTYTSKVTYAPIDTFQGRLLKNGKVKLNAEVVANSENRSGVHSGVVTYTVDSGVTIDQNKIKITYYEAATGITHTITDYTIENNIITVKLGKDAAGISDKGDKINIELEGMLNKIGDYQTEVVVTGKLKDLRGVNTNIDLGEIVRASNNDSGNGRITVEYQMPQAKIQITKTSSITEEKLNNATFTLYEWDGTQYVEKETITDDNQDGIYESQYYEWNVTTNGKYKVVETGVPENHKNLNFTMEYMLNQLKPENYTVTPDYSNNEYKISYELRNPDDFDRTDGTVENEPYKIKAKVEVLDSETRQQIVNPAKFRIYEWDNEAGEYKIYTSYTTGKEVEMERQQDKTYLSNEWLYYTKNNQGKYRIIEEKAPIGYYGDFDENKQKRTYDLTIQNLVGLNEKNNEMTITLTNEEGHFTNRRTKTQVILNKIDSQTKGSAQADATLEGAEYEIYAKDNIYHADGITTNYAQPKARGAAEEDETALLYKKDELIATNTTDAEGRIIYNDLECGTYYIKEKTPSVGYIIDKKIYEIDITYQDESIETEEAEATSEGRVKKQGFQIYKIRPTDRTEYEGQENAGFTIYQINQLSIVKEGKISKNEDGTYTVHDEVAKNDPSLTKYANSKGNYKINDVIDYYYKIHYTEGNEEQIPQDETHYYPYRINEEKVKDYSESQEGSDINELRTGNDGYMNSPELAFGEYIVLETSVPRDLETAKPIYINIKEDLRTPQKLKFITDENFETKIKVYKKDSVTGKTVLQNNVKYVIYNEAGELQTLKSWSAENGYIEYGTLDTPFITGNEGYFITPMRLPKGKYTIVELEAPNGYVLNGHEGYTKNGQLIENAREVVSFEINTTGVYYTDDYLNDNVIVINQENTPQVGTITIETKGEYVKEANQNENQEYEFTYEERPVEGATYQIIAKEDILSQDGHNIILYKKGEIVQTITTNSEGKAYADNLPIGKYYIQQTVAGNGFTLNTEQKEFEITYGTNNQDLTPGTKEWKEEAQQTPVTTTIGETYTNTRQDLKITVNKIDGETREPIQGTKIGLYAAQNIQNQKTGETIVTQDTLITEKTTNEQGQIIYQNNLPLANYYIAETQASTGYVTNYNEEDINGTYDKAQQPVKEVGATLENYKTYLRILKTDTNMEPLPGATLAIKKGNETIKTWETTDDFYEIKGLEVNEQYELVETKPAPGYVTADNIPFRITEYGEVQTRQPKRIQTRTVSIQDYIIMEDESSKIKVELVDQKTGEQVPGATLKIVDENGNVVATWTTDGNPHRIENLPIGHYTLIEEKAPTQDGYATVKQVEFDVIDTKEEQRIEMVQERTKLQIEILDKDTEKPVPGSTIQIIKITKETDDEGNEIIKEEIIQEIQTTEDPVLIDKLPVGDYIIREKDTPTDQGYVTIEDIPLKIEDTPDIQKVTLPGHDVTKLQIEIKDKQTGEPVEGVKLQIIDKKTGEVVKEIITTKEPTIIEKLPVGEYILKQLEDGLTDNGYVREEDQEIEIINTRDIQKVTKEQDYTKLQVQIVDPKTKEPVEGATLQIINKETGEVIQEWVTGKEPKRIDKLPVGQYQLVQTKAPTDKGYVNQDPIDFEVKETADVQIVEMQAAHTITSVTLKDPKTGEPVIGATLKIIDEEGNVVKEWVTDENPYIIDNLPVGKYTIIEENTPTHEGYVTNKPIEIEIKETKEEQKIEIIQEISKLQVKPNQDDEDDKTEEKPEITLEIIKITKETDDEGNEVIKEEVVQEIKVKDDPVEIEKLPVGDYIIREKDTPTDKGYVTIEDIPVKIEDTTETQEITLPKHDVSKLQIDTIDKETGKQIPGITLQIVNKETGEVVKEIVTTEEPTIIEKLPIGDYILKQKEEDVNNHGYIKQEDKEFSIIDTREIQKVTQTQDYTKLQVNIIDKETKKPVVGATLQIIDKKTGKVVEEWISGNEPKQLNRLPVGEYTLVQTAAPELKGYVNQEPIDFEITATAELQIVTMEAEYTKTTLTITDEKTKEPIPDIKITIKDEQGNTVLEIEDKEGIYEIEKLPVGNYIVEANDVPYGYKPLKQPIKITATNKGKQEIHLEREIFDIEVQTWVQEIVRNNKTEYTNKRQEQKLRKLDIKDSKIKTENIKITYNIRVKNIGKITGQVGKVVVNVPAGMEFKASDNKGYWKEENGKIVTTGLAGRDLKAASYADIQIILRWKNGLENFGTKIGQVAILEVKSDNGFEEANLENNVGKTAEVIIGVSTGEMNLVWACWILVITLILVEIYITKKLKIKRFRIKDKTLKYKDQNNEKTK